MAENNEKLFTQEEVNQIVSERLKRVKTASEPANNGADDSAVNALNERETAVRKRESRLECVDYLDTLNIKKEHKTELLKTISTDDVEAFKTAADGMVSAFGLNKQVHGAVVSTPPTRIEDDNSLRLRDAFGLKR